VRLPAARSRPFSAAFSGVCRFFGSFFHALTPFKILGYNQRIDYFRKNQAKVYEDR
jgi:hypothetical protein